jgi:tetratricopeptide (TPR) repeat protein
MRLADARTKLSDNEGVEEALKRALEVQTSNAEVRDRLRSLYERGKNWKGLADLLVGDAYLIRDLHPPSGNGEQSIPASTPPVRSLPPGTSPPPHVVPAHISGQVQLLRRAAEIHLKERNSATDAAALLERASALVPHDRELLLVLCDSYTASGRERDATQVLEKVIASFGGKRTKELALYHHKLAKALSSLGERDQALNQLDLAFKIDPRSIEVLKDLGVLAFETNDLDRATKTFKALLLQKLEPTVGITKGEVFYYLGEISAKQGDKARAVQMLERAIESDPKLDRAKTRLAQLKS